MRLKFCAVITVLLFLTASLSMSEVLFCISKIAEEHAEENESEEYYKKMALLLHGTSEDGDCVMNNAFNKIVSPDFCFGVAGWIYIEDTCIDYPVMQEAGTSRGFYLDHRPDGKYASCGSLYIPAGDSIGSDNVIIYGHHMRNGSMFASLASYRDKKWANDHRCISLITPDGVRTYMVTAVLVQSADRRSFRWEEYIDFTDNNEHIRYGDRAREESVIELDNKAVGLDGNTRYLSLVTCDYSVNNGRLAVIAVLCD